MFFLLQGRFVIGKNEFVYLRDVSFVIPKNLREKNEKFERAKLQIRRMDEFLVSPEDQNEAKRQRHEETSLGLEALAAAAHRIQKVAFKEILSVSTNENETKIDPITDFQEAHDFVEFDQALVEHRNNLAKKTMKKPSDFLYLKFCLIFEIRRDENESCLRIFLHDIIFKFHLTDFRLRCQIHVKKPVEDELLIDKTLNESHLVTNYSAEIRLDSADWIDHQEAELYVTMKIDSLAMNKYVGHKFWDMTHLHVKNVPHGASKIFLREMTPVSRPHKIVSFFCFCQRKRLNEINNPTSLLLVSSLTRCFILSRETQRTNNKKKNLFFTREHF